jgi:hypothetical protein
MTDYRPVFSYDGAQKSDLTYYDDQQLMCQQHLTALCAATSSRSLHHTIL